MSMLRLHCAFAAAVFIAGAAVPAKADATADHLAVVNLVTCHPFGIDAIGRGDFEAGLQTWKECFADNYRFSVFVGRGETTECPGEKCPFPKETNVIEMRAKLARSIFQAAGFVRTSHHLTNINVSFPEPDRARVRSYVQAWHVKQDGAIVTGVGTWDVEVKRYRGVWRISIEDLRIIGAGGLESLMKK